MVVKKKQMKWNKKQNEIEKFTTQSIKCMALQGHYITTHNTSSYAVTPTPKPTPAHTIKWREREWESVQA